MLDMSVGVLNEKWSPLASGIVLQAMLSVALAMLRSCVGHKFGHKPLLVNKKLIFHHKTHGMGG